MTRASATATRHTASEWYWKRGPIDCPVAVFHSATVPVRLRADERVAAGHERDVERIGGLPVELLVSLPGVEVPQGDPVGGRRGRERALVGSDRDAEDHVGVVVDLQWAASATAVALPEPDLPVVVSGHELP